MSSVSTRLDLGTDGNTRPGPIPPRGGVGLKPEHYQTILDTRPDVGWLEIHAENYMGAGGPPHHYLSSIRELYPISLHGVALSIGSDGPLDPAHLARLRTLVDRYKPGLFSEHLAWSTHEGAYLADLLPLPYTEATLARVAEHIDEAQQSVGMQMLLENPTSYLRFAEPTMPEIEFLAEVVRRTGCGLLLDVNNVAVSAANLGFDPYAYLSAFPSEHVQEMHLAGYEALTDGDDGPPRLDTHDRPVAADVWKLFRAAVHRCGPRPALIEWDSDIPEWPVLEAEAHRADHVMAERRTNIHAAAH